jgi:hypothetical protein
MSRDTDAIQLAADAGNAALRSVLHIVGTGEADPTSAIDGLLIGDVAARATDGMTVDERFEFLGIALFEAAYMFSMALVAHLKTTQLPPEFAQQLWDQVVAVRLENPGGAQ